jgi:hypothetical protein
MSPRKGSKGSRQGSQSPREHRAHLPKPYRRKRWERFWSLSISVFNVNHATMMSLIILNTLNLQYQYCKSRIQTEQSKKPPPSCHNPVGTIGTWLQNENLKEKKSIQKSIKTPATTPAPICRSTRGIHGWLFSAKSSIYHRWWQGQEEVRRGIYENDNIVVTII